MKTAKPPYEETYQRQLTALKKLLSVTRELAAQNNLDDVLQVVTRSARDALSCERASLYLYDEQQQELYTRVATKLEIEEIRSSIENGITGWVARRRKSANIPDPKLDARWNSSIDRQTGFETRNILAQPLISQHDDRLLGVLQLLNKRGGDFDEFDEQLAEAFAAHATTALERAGLLEETRRSQELQTAIDLGRGIQKGFLPDELSRIPGYDVAAWWEPAEQVSGDYYDLFPLPDCRTGLVVADVSGHGVGASLMMASARAMLRVLSRTASDPDDIVFRLTNCMKPDLKEGRFITLLMTALDPQTHELTWANAGHAPAFVYRRQSDEFETLEPTTVPLGFPAVEGDAPEQSLTLDEGDVLVLATDGIIELRNANQQMFRRDRLEELVRQHADGSAEDLVAAVRESVNAFCPCAAPPDDMTLLIAKRNIRQKS